MLSKQKKENNKDRNINQCNNRKQTKMYRKINENLVLWGDQENNKTLDWLIKEKRKTYYQHQEWEQ